jgi:hypothetical protein
LTPDSAQAIAALIILAGFALRFVHRLPALWDDLLTPSSGESAHHRGGTLAGHMILGACLIVATAPFFGGLAAYAPASIAAAYWLAKEARDVARGGDPLDGLEDTFAVWIGALYGPWWWPFVALAGVGYVMLVGARK